MLITVLLSALFGGLLSAIITQYFFEFRDKRQLLLRKYEDVLKNFTSHQKRVANYVNRLRNILKILHRHCTTPKVLSHNVIVSLSDDHSTSAYKLAAIDEHKMFFDSDQFHYIDEITFIQIISYYDHRLQPVADNYYKISSELLDTMNTLFDLLDKGGLPTEDAIDTYKQCLDNHGLISKRLLQEIRTEIQEKMKTPWNNLVVVVKKNFSRIKISKPP